MKQKTYFILFIGITSLLAVFCKKTENRFDENAFVKEVIVETATFNFLPTSTTNQIIVHDNYTLSYNEKYEQAEWVAYHLTKNQLCCKSNGKWNMIGFLVPHKESDLPLYKFVVPVDKIEQLTKIDFFLKLDDAIENQLEKKSDYKDWSFN